MCAPETAGESGTEVADIRGDLSTHVPSKSMSRVSAELPILSYACLAISLNIRYRKVVMEPRRIPLAQPAQFFHYDPAQLFHHDPAALYRYLFVSGVFGFPCTRCNFSPSASLLFFFYRCRYECLIPNIHELGNFLHLFISSPRYVSSMCIDSPAGLPYRTSR